MTESITPTAPKQPEDVTDEMLHFMDGMLVDNTLWPYDKLKSRFQISLEVSEQVFQYWFNVRIFYGVEYWSQVKEETQ